MPRRAPFRIAVLAIFVCLFVAVTVLVAYAGDPSGAETGTAETILGEDTGLTPGNFGNIAERVGKHELAINYVWMLVAGFLVIFMAAGFQLLETGFARAKNAAHVSMKNFIALPLGVIGFLLAGFALMFGGLQLATVGGTSALDGIFRIADWGLFGTKGWFLSGGAYDVGVFVLFLFQVGFVLTAVTIPSGAMAERMKISAFALNCLFISMLLYPVFGMWVWGGGWLAQIGDKWGLGHGFVDFAGSGVVHSVGGLAALAGAIILGARIGKFNRDGSPNPMPGHHIPMALFGTFVLLFGWFGFNAGSSLSGNDLRISVVAVNTLIAAAFGGTAAMVYVWARFGKPDPSMVANGLLAGLVAITAPCAFVEPWSAALIGVIAGFLVVEAVLFWERRKIDDPVGAVAVHAVNGIWGLLALGLFANGVYGDGWNGVEGTVRGLLYGDPTQLAAQGVGVGAVIAWAFGLSLVWFKVLKHTIGLRVSSEDELAGLDIPELGVMAYPDFLEAKGEVFTAPEGGFWVAPLPAGASPNGGREQPEPVTAAVRVVRNPESAKPGAPMYFFQVEAPGLAARLPVWRQGTPGDPYVKEVYRTELLGQRLERGNLASLEATVRQTVSGILGDGAVPRHLFRTPDGMHIPIFRRGRIVWAAVGDRRFEAPDLGELKATVAEHLGLRAGLRHAADLELVALAPEDLRGVPPVFLFTHRDISVAVFARPWGALYTELAGQDLEAAPGMEGVLALRREVAGRLHEVGRLYDPTDLSITALSPETWAAWAGRVERADELDLSWGDSVPSYRLGDTFLAALPGPKGDLTVWLGRDRWDLSSRIEREARSQTPTVSYR